MSFRKRFSRSERYTQTPSPRSPSSANSRDSSLNMPLDVLSHRVFNAIPGNKLVWNPQILFRPGADEKVTRTPHMRVGVSQVNGTAFRGAENEILQGDLVVSGKAEEQGAWYFEFDNVSFQDGTQGNKYVLEFTLHLDGGKVGGSLSMPEISILGIANRA